MSYERTKLKQVDNNLFSTDTPVIKQYQYCCFELCGTTTDFVASKMKIYSFDGKLVQPYADVANKCTVANESCQFIKNVIVWNNTLPKFICPYSYKGSYLAQRNGKAFIIDQLQAAFHTSSVRNSCVAPGIEVFISNDVVIRTENVAVNQRLKQVKRSENSDPINIKLNYMQFLIDKSQTDRFKQVWGEICKNTQRFLNTVNQLLLVDPTLGVRAFLQTDDVIAEFYGNVIQVWRCNQVHVPTVNYSHKIKKQCFKYLPIKYNGKIQFVLPGTRDITETSPTVECTNKKGYAYKDQLRGWQVENNSIFVRNIPIEIAWNDPKELLPFHTPSIFSVLHTDSSSLVQLRQNFETSLKIQNNVKMASNQKIKNTAYSLFELLAVIGHSTHHLVNDSSTVIEKIVNNLISPSIYFVTKVSGVILLLVTIGYVIYTKRLFSCMSCCINLILPRFPRSNRENRREIRVNERRTRPTMNMIASSNHALYNTKVPHIEVILNNTFFVTALIDSGAVFSLLDHNIAQSLPNITVRMTDSKPVAANGEPIDLLGQAYITVNAADVEETILVHLQRNSTLPLILGTNFLSRFKRIELNWAKSEVKFKNEPIPCNGMVSDVVDQARVVVDEDLTIPARSILRFSAPVSKQFDEFSEIQFEPKVLTNPNIYFASIVCNIQDGRIPVQVLNTNNFPVHIRNKTKVGTVFPFSENEQKQNLQVDQESFQQWIIRSINLPDILTEKEKHRVVELLATYPNSFARDDKDSGQTNLIRHQINTGDSQPVRKFPYRTSPREKEIIKAEVQILEEKGIIRKSISPWSSNIVLVKKKGGDLRMCIDYRPLNNVTKKDVYPLPNIQDVLDLLNGMKFFTKIDQANAYFCIPIEEKDKEKTAFSSPVGLYE